MDKKHLLNLVEELHELLEEVPEQQLPKVQAMLRLMQAAQEDKAAA